MAPCSRSKISGAKSSTRSTMAAARASVARASSFSSSVRVSTRRAAVDPWTDSICVDAVDVAKGSKVTLRPGRRRADAQDLFLVGRVATVEGVFADVDGEQHVAVTLDDDPAAELHQWHGRFLYFHPDEVEPLR
jgi:hypothetical protein